MGAISGAAGNGERLGETKCPTLSIIVPVYNGADYVSNCIKLIREQTFRDWEAVIVDDGSKDGSGRLLDDLVRGDERFHILHRENGGTAKARNSGMSAAHGKYMTFLDCDDEPHPDMYEKLVNLIESTDADVAVCGYNFKLEKMKGGRAVTTYLEKKYHPDAFYGTRREIRENIVDMWDCDILPNVWNKVYRSSVISDKMLRFPDGHVYTEDGAFNRLFMENCDSIALTSECLYDYIRERAGAMTEKYHENYFEIRDKDFHLIKQHFRNLGIWDEKSREYTCRFFLERVSGALENLFHSGNSLGGREKLLRIRAIITHPDVREASRYAKPRSRKMKLLTIPITHSNPYTAYIVYGMVYQIRKHNPSLFHRLKSRR